MYSQKDQDTYCFILKEMKIIFCARIGNGFLNGHYNLLKEFIMNGGRLKFLHQKNLIYCMMMGMNT